MVEVHLTHDDGSTAVIGTDTSWKTTTIPPNTTAELTLPKRSPWSGGLAETEAHALEPGSHRFEIK